MDTNQWENLLENARSLAFDLTRKPYGFSLSDLEDLESSIFKQIIGPSRKRMRKGIPAVSEEIMILLGILFGETIRSTYPDRFTWVFPEKGAPIEQMELNEQTKEIEQKMIPYSDAEYFFNAKLMSEKDAFDYQMTLHPILRAKKFMHDETDAFCVVAKMIDLQIQKHFDALLNQPTDESGWTHLDEKNKFRVTTFTKKQDHH